MIKRIYHFGAQNPTDLLCPFNKNQTIAEKGVVVGCNANFEWMLEWWWHHYSKHNDYPVVFADAGLSKKYRDWCLERGCILDLNHPPLKGDKDDDKVFGIEHGWKVFAVLYTPFEKIAWIDVDCEVVADIGDIFDHCSKLSITHDPFFFGTPLGVKVRAEKLIAPGERFYNSGVIATAQGGDLLMKWAELTIRGPQGWRQSDQHLLQLLIHENPSLFKTLPFKFNVLTPFAMFGRDGYLAPNVRNHPYLRHIPTAAILHRLASHPETLATIRLETNELRRTKKVP